MQPLMVRLEEIHMKGGRDGGMRLGARAPRVLEVRSQQPVPPRRTSGLLNQERRGSAVVSH